MSHLPCSLIHCQSGRFNFYLHISQHKRNGLFCRNGFTELYPFFSIFNGFIISAFRNSQGLCTNTYASAVQSHHGNLKAVPFFSQKILCRNPHVLEDKFPLYRCTNTHFYFFFTVSKAFHPFFYDESAHAFSTLGLIRCCKNHCNFGFSAVRVKYLGTVQRIGTVFIFHGCRTAVQCIRARIGFCQSEGTECRPFRQGF